MFKIKPIKTAEDYKEALKAIDEVWDSEPDTPSADSLEILVTLVEKYESEHYKIEAPDPIEAVKFVIEQKQMKNTALTKILGSRSRVSEILNKHRKLTLKMIRNLHDVLHIPYEILATDYSLRK